MTIENRKDNNLLPHQRIIVGIIGNLTKSSCPTHGTGVYFERIGEGDLFECAHTDHHKNVSISLSNKPKKLHDR